MREGLKPKVHLFVCENRREGSPLGPGCGDAGERVSDVLKSAVSRSGLIRDVWVTKTRCLGLCPVIGTSVAVYSASVTQIFTEVVAEDCRTLFELAQKEATS